MPSSIFTAPLAGLTDASVDETKSTPIPLNLATQVGGTVIWSSGCSAGQVVFEIAPTSGYTGSWHVLFTSDFINDGSESFTFPGPFDGFGRWRINTAIVGGTVSTVTQKLGGE